MLSGIGPADHLRQHGIPVVADLPGVGENLQDHHEVPVIAATNRRSVGYFGEDRGWRMIRNGLQYLAFGSGPVTTIGVDCCCFYDPDGGDAGGGRSGGRARSVGRAESRPPPRRSSGMRSGSPTEEPVDAGDLRVAIVAARWHEQLMDGDLTTGIATLLPVALGYETNMIPDEAYTAANEQ